MQQINTQTQTYQGLSYLQHLYKQFQTRKQSISTKEDESFLDSQFGSDDVSDTLKVLEGGKNVILSHSSYKKLESEELTTIFAKMEIKNIDLIDSLEKMQQYAGTKHETKEGIIFISIFGFSLLSYKPFLAKILTNLKVQQKEQVCKKIIIYCQRIQQNQIYDIINLFQREQSIETKFELIELDIPMPFETSVSKNLLQVLERFLKHQIEQQFKKDVVIFSESSEDMKKKLFYLIKTQGFHGSTQIIFSSNVKREGYMKDNTITRIYIIQNTKILSELGYDLSSVYLILDYQQDTYQYFDYKKVCYVEVRDKFSYNEKYRRINLITGNIGEYVCDEKYADALYMSNEEENKYIDYGNYCLNMVKQGLNEILQRQMEQISEIRYCVEFFKEIQIIADNKIDQQILKLSKVKINPILAKIILSSKQNKKRSHLLALTHAVLTSHNLYNQANQRPSPIWHQSGYLESCIDIIIKMNLNQNIVGQNRLLQEIISTLQINQQVYDEIMKEYVRICELLKMQEMKWDNQLQKQDFNQLLEDLIINFKPAVCTYSGSRRLGYIFKGTMKGCLAHRRSLISQLNQKPNFIWAAKLYRDAQSQEQKIMACNYIHDEIIISAFGCIPTMSKKTSYGQCQVQFLNVSSAVFQHLSKYNGLQMEIFQKESDCSIEANIQLNTITIQCFKERQKEINEKFSKMLKDIEEMYKKQTKYFRQTQNLQIALSSGGLVTDLFIKEEEKSKQQSLDMILVKNLAPEIGIQELKQLFDEFVQLKDINMKENFQNKDTNEAIISFYSNQDLKTFKALFNGCNYYNHCMVVQPYVIQEKTYTAKDYLLFQWNTWKSTGEALIGFSTADDAKNALNNVKALAGEKAKIQIKGTMIFIQGLNSKIDEKQIANWVSGFGKILNLQVRRQPLKNKIEQNVSIKRIINEAFVGDNIEFKAEGVWKGKNGHRSCQVKINDDKMMNEIYFVLNQTEGKAGIGKLYVSPVFSEPIKLPQADDTYANVYQDIIEDISMQMGKFPPIQVELIKNPLQYVMILKANTKQEMELIRMLLDERVKGQTLNFQIQDYSILFSELALKNLFKLEKEFPIKIIPDHLEKKIKILCKPSSLNLIQKQINTKIQESFEYQIPLYQKAYTYLHKNINDIIGQDLLTKLNFRFEPITKSLLLEGNMIVLEKAREKISKALVKLKENNQQSGQNSHVCKLCCEEMVHPFKLQGCRHSFCFDCLHASIKVALNNITLYPLKCPECMDKIWICDLNCLLDQKDWPKVNSTAINQFVFTHPGQFMFCLTAGCNFICNIKHKSSYSCKQCKKSYCLLCNNQAHPGMTCHEARYGSDRLFSEYMLQIGGRVCANRQCRAPIQRISGCFKVQCSRCKKCMCFKCPPNSMVAYDTPEQTYNHLNKLHGGCF